MFLFENLFCYRFLAKISAHPVAFPLFPAGLVKFLIFLRFPERRSDFGNRDLEVWYPQIVLIDSTALRRSLYDSHTKWGVSIRYHWFKGYKLHLCTTAEGIILSHVLTTANRNDAAVAPELLASLEQWDIDLH
jgi:hypothetical protein